MRRFYLLTCLIPIIFGCGVDQAEYDKVKKERDDLATKVNEDAAIIQVLRDSITMLSFPADQRLAKINDLVSSEDFDEAKKEINRLKALFPESKEARSTSTIIEKVDRLIAQKKAEEERIKALGFKALKTTTTITIGYNKVEFSNINVGNTFTYDSNSSYYSYNTADRGDKYVTAAMRITSEDKNPKLPQLAIYSISGDSMEWESNFRTKFARWDDYGSYLGNYHDNGNDFAKTSSVRFKVGTSVAENIVKGPYALVLKKENVLTRKTEEYGHPPVSYTGSVDYPYTLKLEDFTKDGSEFVVVKIANL